MFSCKLFYGFLGYYKPPIIYSHLLDIYLCLQETMYGNCILSLLSCEHKEIPNNTEWIIGGL